jgi:heptosyltransferase II
MVLNPLRSKPWKKKTKVPKVLAIRFQALGDTVITLPYLNDLRQRFPDARIDFLTRREVCQIPRDLSLFDNVLAIGGGRNAKLQFILMLFYLPLLWWNRYDIVLDLQNNKVSRIVRILLFPPAYAEFDRSSAVSAGQRTQRTIDAAGLGPVQPSYNFGFKNVFSFSNVVQSHVPHIVLNPAGYSPSRNWPIENYAQFAEMWNEKLNRKVKFVLLLMPSLKEKADYLEKEIGENCINLTGKAGQSEAFRVISKCTLMLSEDSGLMHMAWVQGIPTIALFSSSRKDWSAPQGPNSVCLDSGDLACGPCQLEVCQFGDNRCLTRYSPARVFEISVNLIERKI